MKRIELSHGKRVLESDPYEPDPLLTTTFVGREAELRMVAAAWMACGRLPSLSPLLVGEPGVGKNRLVYELSRITSLPLFIMQGHEDVTAEDLACAVRFGEGGNQAMDYILSPLVTAMREGGICFIDEIGKMRPRALALLVSVLDERRYIDSTLLGERIYAHPDFRFIAATNTGEVNGLPEFVRSRLRPVIEVGHPPRAEIERILGIVLETQQNRDALLEAFWSLWAEAKHRPTPRDAIHHFSLASRLGVLDSRKGEAADDPRPSSAAEGPEGHGSLGLAHLREAYEQLFAGTPE